MRRSRRVLVPKEEFSPSPEKRRRGPAIKHAEKRLVVPPKSLVVPPASIRAIDDNDAPPRKRASARFSPIQERSSRSSIPSIARATMRHSLDHRQGESLRRNPASAGSDAESRWIPLSRWINPENRVGWNIDENDAHMVAPSTADECSRGNRASVGSTTESQWIPLTRWRNQENLAETNDTPSTAASRKRNKKIESSLTPVLKSRRKLIMVDPVEAQGHRKVTVEGPAIVDDAVDLTVAAYEDVETTTEVDVDDGLLKLISLDLSDDEDTSSGAAIPGHRKASDGDPAQLDNFVLSDEDDESIDVETVDGDDGAAQLVSIMLNDKEDKSIAAASPAMMKRGSRGNRRTYVAGGETTPKTHSPATPASISKRRWRARQKAKNYMKVVNERNRMSAAERRESEISSTPRSGQTTVVPTTPLSSKSEPSPAAKLMRKSRLKKKTLSIYPKPAVRSNVGKLEKRCPYCLALHFPKEKFRCCNNGKVRLAEPRMPPPVLLDLLLGNSSIAKKHQQELCKMNTLYSMAGKSCYTENVPGRGVPITKVKGTFTHTVSSVRTGPDSIARFGSLFTHDPRDATEERINNTRLSQNCDHTLLLQLSQEFADNNVMCKKFKFMADVLQEEEVANKGVLPFVYMRLVSKEEADNNPAMRKLMKNDHHGRYNTVDETMVCFIFKTDDEGTPLLPKGLNVYPTHDGGPGRVIPYFDPHINVLCYPFIHPHGIVDFRNGTIDFADHPNPMTEEEKKMCIDFIKEFKNLNLLQEDAVDDDVEVDSEQSDGSEDSDVEAVLEIDEDGEVSTNQDVEEEEELMGEDDGNRVLVEVDDEGLENDPPGENEDEDLPVRTAPPSAPIQDTEESAHLSGDESGESDVEEGDLESEIEEDPAGTDEENELDDGISLEDKKARHVSHLQYLRYRLRVLMKSKFAYHNVISATRLSQHYIIDNLLRIFEQRMWHVQQNNTQTLGSKKNAFISTMSKAAERRGRRLGMTVNVPKKVKGGPAYLRDKYENTMAMIAEIGNPDLFITFTGNRKWPEIEKYRKPGQTWADIAHIAVRVFFEKFEEFKKLVLTSTSTKGGLFGKVKGFAYSIELQQRGMPHAHVLLTLEDGFKLDTPEKVDDVVWAQLPDLSKFSDDDPRRKEMEKLRELVSKHMVHTPCVDQADSYCKKKQAAKKNPQSYRRCDKGFPKEYLEQTTFHEDGYVLPRRPNNGQYVDKVIDYKSKKSVKATNQFVVPFNPFLLTTFDCHINVEICSTVKAAKYIFKYIFKGFDKTLVEFIESCRISNGTRRGAANMAAVTIGGHVILPRGAVVNRARRVAMEKDAEKRLRTQNVPLIDANGKKTLVYDETKILEVMRSMTVTEALLSIYQIPTAYLNHVVVSSSVHLPDEEVIYWKKGTEEAKAEALERPKPSSKLTAWFALNLVDPAARSFTYSEIAKHYMWKQREKKWVKRTKNMKVVSRVFSVSPRFAQQFALRLLTMNVAGATCFVDLMTFEGRVYDSFVDAARARGLMNDEREWEYAMEAAVQKDMPIVIRRLFATICAYCPVKDKQALFDKYAEHMFDSPRDSTISEATKRARALFHIESILKHNRLTNKDVALEEVDPDALDWNRAEWNNYDENAVTRISPEEARKLADTAISTMNSEQRKAFDTLYRAANPRGSRRCFFLQGAGGTGKTFVYKALYHALIADGIKVLMVAHTGIAATLLVNGTTVHRQFCIPVNATGEATCNVQADSAMEQLLHEAEAVIWDEATMSDRRVLAAVDKLLREIEPTDDRPFGGKMLLLGGDWKQLLPVVRNIHSQEVLDFTIKRSTLWSNFDELQLTKNMRVDKGGAEFADLLDKIGRADPALQHKDGTVTIDADMCMESEEGLIDWAYKGHLDVGSCEAIKDTCVLTVLNDATHDINEKVLAMLPGQEHIMKSCDMCSKENNSLEMPLEIYNAITPSGLPPHILKLKKGCVVVLLRNLNVPRGQCNGTRMRVVDLVPNLLTCEIITDGRYKGEIVLVPKIEMEPQDQRDPTHCFKRLQFPVRLAYAMTVNKAQGQSLKKVGLVLRTPVFAHGQLYVALSRARTKGGVKVWQYNMPKEGGPVDVLNIVHKEILV